MSIKHLKISKVPKVPIFLCKYIHMCYGSKYIHMCYGSKYIVYDNDESFWEPWEPRRFSSEKY